MADHYDTPGTTHTVPTMFIKDKKIVDMTFTSWTVRQKGGEWGYDIDYTKFDVNEDFDSILFELPNGCHIINIEGKPGLVQFGAGGDARPMELCENRGEIAWNSTTSPSESHVADVQAQA